jgi:phenylalanyl-tRNA synthetase beta chain
MPKIEAYEESFTTYLGERMDDAELEVLLESAKGELKEHSGGVLKIELNDTNRPDLWSATGLARQLRAARGKLPGGYRFLSSQGTALPSEERVLEVEASVKDIRPFIVVFAARGKKVSEAMLLDIIEQQETLCRNFGRKRKGIAMGVHRERLVRYPLRYRGADPVRTRFTPLQSTEEMSLEEILTRHPKGVEYGWIVKDLPRFPLLEDAEGGVLSFPPVINSARIGAVQVGDDRLFVDMTGPDLDILLVAANIAACDFQDMGFQICPVKIRYPYDTTYGREITTPYYFQKEVRCSLAYASKMLGVPVSGQEAKECLRKAGLDASLRGDDVVVTPPPYRNDFLHPADVVEEIMIGRGMASFEPLWPRDFTIGRLSAAETFSRQVVDTMVGLGYQEMVYNYLGSTDDFLRKMRREGEERALIRIANPMTENYEALRDSILPDLLASEAVSGNALYPHRIFEVGKICRRDERDSYGSVTRAYLGALVSSREASFNDARAHLAALQYYLGREHALEPIEDPRFIAGRCAEVRSATGVRLGVIGELHPEVLGNFGVQMPCAALELDLDSVMAE